jgi:hypothetical protein
MVALGIWGAALARYYRTMESHNYQVKLETISRWVREGRMTERDAALLRGSASQRGFRGPWWAMLAWLEDYSPGASKRWYGDSKRGWKRNVGPACEAYLVAKIQGRLRRSPGAPRPPTKDRCRAHNRQGERCGQWAKPKAEGGRYPTCHYHGACAAPYGKLAWRLEMRWDGKQHRKMWVRVKQADRFRGTDGVDE